MADTYRPAYQQLNLVEKKAGGARAQPRNMNEIPRNPVAKLNQSNKIMVNLGSGHWKITGWLHMDLDLDSQ